MTGRPIVGVARWPEDAEAVRAVRHQVFVREQGVPESLEWDGRDGECQHLLARAAGGAAVGTARLTPEGQIGRMAVLAPWRGLGIGARLLQAAVELAARRGLGEVFLHAQIEAMPFYLRYGFTPEGEEYMEANIRHRTMRRSLQGATARHEH